VNVQTLRYYERRGLLPEPARRGAGYRNYDEAAVRSVRFIKRAQDVGFSLEEVRELLELRDRRRSPAAVRQIAVAKLRDIDGACAGSPRCGKR
jgi:MerR family transcriptional regulator, copper efflux regulator